jgi:hypothetical protein
MGNERLRKLLPLILALAIVVLSTLPRVPSGAAAVLFQDGFESGDFSAWTGIGGTNTPYVGLDDPQSEVRGLTVHHGYGLASADVLGGQSSYCYKSVSAPELYARGYFAVDGESLVDEGDHSYFIVFRAADGNSLACAGCRYMGGQIKWCLRLRQGTGYVDVYGSRDNMRTIGDALVYVNPYGWFCFELHWKKGTTTGGADLWVNGVKVCSSWGKNTASYGDARSVRVGLPEVHQPEDSGFIINFDCVKISATYIGLESPLFQDGFGSGSFSAWSGTATSSGETKTISWSRSHHGATSAKFTTNGGGGYERAYTYKTITPMYNTYARGYFYVSKSGIVDVGDRMFFIVFKSGTQNIAYAGWKKMEDSSVRWCITAKTDTGYSDWYLPEEGSPLPSPVVGRWYCVEFIKPFLEPGVHLWANGQQAVDSHMGDTYGVLYELRVSTIRFGLADTYGVGASTVYADCCAVDKYFVWPE